MNTKEKNKLIKLKILAVIPARMGSSRFPGKPLAKINSIPMIQHVYKNVKKNKYITDVIVATCDDIIKKFILSIGGQVVMTSKKHKRASDRTAEALLKYEKKTKKKFDIVVMIQGDEPLIKSKMITESILPFVKFKNINVVNLKGKIYKDSELNDKNCIKVVADKNNFALFFSRLPIPIKNEKIKAFKQICVIPFRRDYLIYYNNLKTLDLELEESIDMLRVLEHGEKVYMQLTNNTVQSVDVKNDIKKVEKILNR